MCRGIIENGLCWAQSDSFVTLLHHSQCSTPRTHHFEPKFLPLIHHVRNVLWAGQVVCYFFWFIKEISTKRGNDTHDENWRI